MDSEEIHSLVQEETRIRFGCNHTLNRKVNNREAAFRHRFQVFSNIYESFGMCKCDDGSRSIADLWRSSS
jgi:hypothetical protein